MKTHTDKLIKSPLKWAGGKSKLVPKIKAIWGTQLSRNPDLRWVDLFAGSCVIPLNLQPQFATINDYNGDLIRFWREIQKEGALETEGFTSTEAYFQTVREMFNRHHEPKHFYYLNRTAFNGLCRFNSSGIFNVGWGKYKNPQYQSDFNDTQKIIRNWFFTATCFRNIDIKPNDFVFADPPYDDGFTQYSRNKFSWEDQLVLAKKLAAHPGISIATNKTTPRILNLYESLGFQIELIDMPRRISCKGNRESVQEMFATKGL